MSAFATTAGSPAFVTHERLSAPARLLNALLICYVVLLPYQIEFAFEHRYAPADLCLAGAAIAACSEFRYRRAVWSMWHVALLLVFVMGTYVAAQRSGELSRYVILNKDVGIVFLMSSYLMFTSAIRDWEQIRQLIRLFVLGVMWQNVLAVLIYVAGFSLGIATPWTSYDGQRLSGLMVDPNAYAGMLALTLALMHGMNDSRRPLLGPWMTRFARITLIAGLILTFSRTGWISLAAAVLFLWLVRPKSIAPSLIAAALAAAGVLLLAGSRFLSFADTMASRPDQVRGRFLLAEHALSQFAEYPFAGGGLSSFREAEGTIAHNTPLWFLADFGLIGFVVFGGLMLWVSARAWRTFKIAPLDQRPMALALVAGHLTMFVVSLGIEAFYQRHWWMVMAFAVRAHSLAVSDLRLIPSRTGARS